MFFSNPYTLSYKDKTKVPYYQIYRELIDAFRKEKLKKKKSLYLAFLIIR